MKTTVKLVHVLGLCACERMAGRGSAIAHGFCSAAKRSPSLTALVNT